MYAPQAKSNIAAVRRGSRAQVFALGGIYAPGIVNLDPSTPEVPPLPLIAEGSAFEVDYPGNRINIKRDCVAQVYFGTAAFATIGPVQAAMAVAINGTPVTIFIPMLLDPATFTGSFIAPVLSFVKGDYAQLYIANLTNGDSINVLGAALGMIEV